MKNKLWVPLGAGLLAMVCRCSAFAQDSAAVSPGTFVPGSGLDSLWPSLGRLAVTLVLVIALIWVTMWLARKFMRGRWAGGSDSAVRILERVHLAPKKSIDVVSVGDRVLVLGVTDSHVELLTELPPGDFPLPGKERTTTTNAAKASPSRRDVWNQARRRMRELFQAARLSGANTPS